MSNSPQIKICGIQDEDMALRTADAGADFIGFVHYPKSPRHVSIGGASLLSRALNGAASSVLLLVDPDDALLEEVKRADAFDLIQLHGTEAPERAAYVGSYLGRPIMKALRIGSADDVAQAKIYEDCVDWMLFDSKPQVADLPGGTGESFDWDMLKGLCLDVPWMLSGGLDPDNVLRAISSVNPVGVDVSSGVETKRGVKNLKKIQSFIEAVHGKKEHGFI